MNQFVGLANYVNVFRDEKVQTSVTFTVMFVVISMIFHVVLGVGLALILNMKFRGRRFLRTIVLIPWAMPAVVIGMAAKWGFNNDYGLVNDFIRRFVADFQYRITLPLITRNVITLCIPFTLWRLTTFDLVYAMTSGGPGEDTSLIAYRITTEAFTNLNVGYAATLAVMLFLVMAVFSFINIKIMNKLSD